VGIDAITTLAGLGLAAIAASDDDDTAPASNVIPFPKPKTADTSKNCPTGGGPNDREKVQQLLEQGKQALRSWGFSGLSLPERVSQAADYNEQVGELNLLIALHNAKCPANRVEPLPTIPFSGKPQ
jgi:hypothetical protein